MTDGISAIDNLGIGGLYSSYNPSMMSMMNGTSPYGMMGGLGAMSGYGAMGMYNPSFMAQQMQIMQQIQEQTDKNRLNHGVQMHEALMNAEVANKTSQDRAFFLKAMEDGHVQQGVRELYDAVRSGDQDAICLKYDALKQYIFNNYSEYFNSSEGQNNLTIKVRNYINELYAQIGTVFNGGAIADLKTDIKAYGETAFTNGFRRSYFGNSGHNKMYTEETINYLYDERINDIGGKNKAAWLGSKLGNWVAEPLTALGVGAIAGGAAAGTGKILLGGIKNAGKYFKWGGKIGAALALAADVLWQNNLLPGFDRS